MSKNVLRFAKLCGGNELINGTNAKNSATETAKFREHICTCQWDGNERRTFNLISKRNEYANVLLVLFYTLIVVG